MIDSELNEKQTQGNGPPSLEHAVGYDGATGDLDILQGEVLDEHSESTQRGLKSRHAQMIALGGAIGTGLFVASGQCLARGGPAFLLACYDFMSLAVYMVITAMTEVAAFLPVQGSSMNLFGHRYVSRSLGFAMGWLYWYSLGILIPYEITAAGLVIEYWNPPVHIGIWITAMLVLILFLNFLPVGFYGETEFWFASVKVMMIFGLLFVSVVLFFGGAPDHEPLYFRYWNNPGATNTYLQENGVGRFVSLLSTLILSAFPFVFAPELMIVTAGEMKNPRRNLPVAAHRYIYRLVLFYITGVLAIGIICPSDEPALTSGGAGAGASPYVIGMKKAGIKGLDSVINAGIIISACSSGNAFLYLSSRSLYSLALSGHAPKLFRVRTKRGVPYRAVGASACFSFLAYLNVATSGALVFNWFVSLTNTSGFISWICSCIVFLRFRKACKAQSITDLPYRGRFQPYGAWCTIVIFTFLTLMNGFTVFWSENWTASRFLTSYIGIPIYLAFYFGHRIHAREDSWARDPESVDLVTGMDQTLAEETVPNRTGRMPWYMWLTKIWT